MIISILWLYPFDNEINIVMLPNLVFIIMNFLCKSIYFVANAFNKIPNDDTQLAIVGFIVLLFSVVLYLLFKILILMVAIKYIKKWKYKYL
jgi:hypothetical protein